MSANYTAKISSEARSSSPVDAPNSVLEVNAVSKLADRASVLVGLIGTGIQASRTPALHEREGANMASPMFTN